jgi:hypothetical protein
LLRQQAGVERKQMGQLATASAASPPRKQQVIEHPRVPACNVTAYDCNGTKVKRHWSIASAASRAASLSSKQQVIEHPLALE